MVSYRIPERYVDNFQNLAKETGITVSELKRRMYDFCFQEKILNEMLPSLSGSIQIHGR